MMKSLCKQPSPSNQVPVLFFIQMFPFSMRESRPEKFALLENFFRDVFFLFKI